MDRDSAVVFIDASVLISCGRHDSTRFQALACEARQRDTKCAQRDGGMD